ncbi:MAG: hypothetical protein RML56_00970 [Burkholderiales bacterium]|nr:hypothetical protein [Burkholderiales bacterium]
MRAVTLCECFAGDGLQHERAFVPTETERALADRVAGCGADEPTVSSASESQSRRNVNRPHAEQSADVERMVQAAQGRFLPVFSVGFGGPFEGRVDPGVVREDVARFVSFGAPYVAPDDPAGIATPRFLKAPFAASPTLPGSRRSRLSLARAGGYPAQLRYGEDYTAPRTSSISSNPCASRPASTSTG